MVVGVVQEVVEVRRAEAVACQAAREEEPVAA